MTWLTEPLRAAVAIAVRAPSSHNSQPWRFRLHEGGVDLRADPARLLSVVDPERRELTMSCGAALLQLELALEASSLRANVSTLPDPRDPDLLARVVCVPGGTIPHERRRLFEAIGTRHTHRGPFLAGTLPSEFVETLRAALPTKDVFAHLITDAHVRDTLASLVATGDRQQASDPRFRRELASWIRPNTSASDDGLPGYSLGLGTFLSLFAPSVIRFTNWGAQQARIDRRLVADAPAIVVLCTAQDTPAQWLRAGQALGTLLLSAAAAGVSAGFMNQPIQCPSLREEVSAVIGQPNARAQFVLRFGHAPPRPATKRRDVTSVID